MRFKRGQKVRIKDWVDIPQNVRDTWGTNVYVGKVGFISEVNPGGTTGYDVKMKGNKYPAFCLEQELELLVRIGEQLMFNFMKG